MMSEYIITANNIYIKLKENMEYFALEAELINEAKCYLINNNALEDLYLSNGTAYIYQDGETYIATYNGLSLNIETKEGMIVDYHIIN